MTRTARTVGLVVGASLLVAAVGLGAAARPADDLSPVPPGFGGGPVTPAEPRTVAWEAAVIGLEPGVDPDSDVPCQRGDDACIAAVVEEMQTRFEALGCSPRAVFAFTYLETTIGVERRTTEPDFFEDPAVVNQLDALFAILYFDAFDNWEAGRIDEVPPAWQMAFAAAESGSTSAMADLLLGMNAHITRDLPYAVAQLLDAQPEGPAARDVDRRDFDRVNLVIDEVTGPMLEGSAERFDPAIADVDLALADTPFADLDAASAVDDIDSTELFVLWRAHAFEMAEHLAAARTPEERAEVEAEIERSAVAVATMALNADAVLPVGLRGEERSAHCERVRTGAR
ncbi:MAG: hypothetical protein JJU45_10665 [Acidimicrobiia bacterium]|nr:hypothetical protein [Acidimicrobiia bacterium]